ncbi:MAG: hypothetical protein RL354_1772, partial [Planctomycetota bacterium]
WLRAEYPFTPRRHRTADGHGLSYLDEGPRGDEAVLMVHGNPTWSFYYRNLVRALAPDLRCIVPDHLGMGLSDHVPGGPRPLARRIGAACAHARGRGHAHEPVPGRPAR